MVLFLYLLFVVLSSLIGDTFILVASIRYNAIKLNKFIIVVMQYIAVCDLLRAMGYILPSMVSMGENMSWISSFEKLGIAYFFMVLFVDLTTILIGSVLISVLTLSKLLMLAFPERTRKWTAKVAHLICVLSWIGIIILMICFVAIPQNGNNLFYKFRHTQHSSTGFMSKYAGHLIDRIMVILIIPTGLIITTTLATLFYLNKARKTSRRSGGQVRWQGMVTVTATATVYCISSVPMIAANGSSTFVKTAWYLSTLNTISNFYIYILTIPSFRHFVKSKVSNACLSAKSLLRQMRSCRPSVHTADIATD